jgi:hypothetical protein
LRTHRSWNASRTVCSRRIGRHFSHNEVRHKGRVSGLNDPLMHVGWNYCGREGKISKGQGRNLTPSISLLRGPYCVVSNSPILYKTPPRRCVSQRISKCVTMRHYAILYSVSQRHIRMYTGNYSQSRIKYPHPLYVHSIVSENFRHFIISFWCHAAVESWSSLFQILDDCEEHG